MKTISTAEQQRLDEQRSGDKPWQTWGPYLSERQWGTVREDYSPQGNAWDYLPHDHARSRAYRWGEDGIGGFSDREQHLCLSLAMWNGKDAILKERLFGLTNEEGNQGEDVKELYYYLDALPSHRYLKMLYKYPQAEYPYKALVKENARRDAHQAEYELLDTGIFDEDRYFDVVIEYVQQQPGDILLEITATNRGPDTASLHLLPHLWFRNTWSWQEGSPKPRLTLTDTSSVEAHHDSLGKAVLHVDGDTELLFCENETNIELLNGPRVQDGGTGGATSRHYKDGINERVTNNRVDAVNPSNTGTRVAAWYQFDIPAGESRSARVRLSPEHIPDPFADASKNLQTAREEADTYYNSLPGVPQDADARRVQRQALAGMIWSKQLYRLDMSTWQDGDPAQPAPPPGRKRNANWRHLDNADIISMPDKWEYPWYAAWDLAFHCVPLAMIDLEFAKQQLVLLTRERYMHANGQLPAYEWKFGDVNPPVHAWATLEVFDMDRKRTGKADHAFLERVFHKLMINFTWWVNRKDAGGRNIFQGGFLGLDNIGVFDRSSALPTGGHIDQADGTSWVAMYSLNLMRMAIVLAEQNPVYEDIATKFFQHFLEIAAAMNDIGGHGIELWDNDDEFFYDVLNLPGDQEIPLKVRSMVGLIPLFATETLEPETLDRLPGFKQRLEWFMSDRPELKALVSRWEVPGSGKRRLLGLLRGHRMKCVLRRMLDETEFLSDQGVRALSKHHLDNPYVFEHQGTRVSVSYEPAESSSNLFGGNSNWRGPVWFPVNYLIIQSLRKYHRYYGEDFKIECPTGSGTMMHLDEVADELSRRLCRIFLAGKNGKRPVFSNSPKHRDDPHFRDHLLFYEYFHGDSGHGVGAAHQTGWTGLVATLLQQANDPGA